MPIVGANAAGITAFENLNQDAGPFQARRSFQQPNQGVPAYSATTLEQDAQAGRTSIWSFKEHPATFKTGSKDAAFRSLLSAINHPTYITLYHEPGSELRAKLFTMADWRAAINRMGDMIHDADKPYIQSCIILEGRWAFNTGNGFGNFNFWNSDFNDTVDVIGFDQYSRSTKPNLTVEGYLANKPLTGQTWAPMSWARDKEKRVIIPEFGISDDIGQAEKAKAIKRFYEWSKAQSDVDVINYFSNNQEVDNGDPGATYVVHDESLQALAEISAAARA